MNSKIISNGILRSLGIIIGIFIVVFFLDKIQSVIVYLAIAGVISLIGRPIVLFLRRRLKFNNTIAVIVTIFLMIGIMFGLFSMFVPLIREQGQNLSLLDVKGLQENLQNLYKQIVDYLQLKNIDIEESFKESGLLSKLDFNAIPDLLNLLLGTIGSFTIGLFSVLFISFFFLKDSRLMEFIGNIKNLMICWNLYQILIRKNFLKFFSYIGLHAIIVINMEKSTRN